MLPGSHRFTFPATCCEEPLHDPPKAWQRALRSLPFGACLHVQRTILKLKTGFCSAPNSRNQMGISISVPRSADVSQVDDVRPAEAPEQIGHLGLRLRV